MKKTLILLLGCLLVFTTSSLALGAVHSSYNDTVYLGMGEIGLWSSFFIPYRNTDTWFKIAAEEPSLFVGGASFDSSGDGTNFIDVDYYQNEQTFLAVNVLSDDNTISDLKGSYLFNCGFFIGLDYAFDEDNNEYNIAPGYRWNFNDQGYLAASVDYLGGEDVDSDINGYDLDFRYYLDNAKLFAQIYLPDEGDSSLEAGAVFQARDNLALGLYLLNWDDENGFLTGMTWSGEKFVFDCDYGYNTARNYFASVHFYDLSGMFNLSDSFRMGAQYTKYGESDPIYTLKIKYADDASQFFFGYTFETDDAPSSYYLGYKKNL